MNREFVDIRTLDLSKNENLIEFLLENPIVILKQEDTTDTEDVYFYLLKSGLCRLEKVIENGKECIEMRANCNFNYLYINKHMSNPYERIPVTMVKNNNVVMSSTTINYLKSKGML